MAFVLYQLCGYGTSALRAKWFVQEESVSANIVKATEEWYQSHFCLFHQSMATLLTESLIIVRHGRTRKTGGQKTNYLTFKLPLQKHYFKNG